MMDETFTFTIGGRDFYAPVMTFLSLHKAWPHYEAMLKVERDTAEARQRIIAKTGTAEDEAAMLRSMIQRTDSALEIVAAAMLLKPDPKDRPSAHELRALLRGGEMLTLNNEVLRLINMSVTGGYPATGEAMAAGSTATSDPSSLNSPPAASAAETPAPSSAT